MTRRTTYRIGGGSAAWALLLSSIASLPAGPAAALGEEGDAEVLDMFEGEADAEASASARRCCCCCCLASSLFVLWVFRASFEC